jgi:hypothetical protein
MIQPLRTRNIPSVAACLVILLTVVGCGRPTMAKVSGTVKWQGKPVPDAMVQFVHKNRPGATGRTDAEGRFSLTTLKPGDGAFLGPVQVTVEPFLPGNDPDKPTPPPPPRPDIPDRYRTVDKTPLTAEVVAGKKNVIDFKLD